MQSRPDDMDVRALLDLRRQQMLVVNPEYQRGAVWTASQRKKLVDSVLRGYPIPLIYLHRIKQAAGSLVSERYEVIDGQQRINALFDYCEGAYKLFDPIKDAAEARYPDFIKHQPCPWARKAFGDLSPTDQERLLDTNLRVVEITTDEPGEARDLFVRLQAGMPLNSQEKRDAWPGQFTDFVLRLGGKPGVARYPGHTFFVDVMKAGTKDRGKFRQLAAQVAMLFLTHRTRPGSGLCDINAPAIDDFYYENLGFDATSADALRLIEVLDRLAALLRDGKRPRLQGHEVMHMVLLIDTLMDDYTPSWEVRFGAALDKFRSSFAKEKLTRDDPNPGEYWLRYGVLTRVNSDRGDNIHRRHEFFARKMYEVLLPRRKDPTRAFGSLEREIVYYRDNKKCAVCDGEVTWNEAEIHHIEEHAKGGATSLDNGVLVHRKCHPKGHAAVKFAEQWQKRVKP